MQFKAENTAPVHKQKDNTKFKMANFLLDSGHDNSNIFWHTQSKKSYHVSSSYQPYQVLGKSDPSGPACLKVLETLQPLELQFD